MVKTCSKKKIVLSNIKTTISGRNKDTCTVKSLKFVDFSFHSLSKTFMFANI